ncbi:MAG: acetolactate decarboxylase [Candidatus Magnetominusculus sp. LBB02]|nr:acetolactate decarboxylase [Candidatus Magnetominusculus sp. LBB02]
MRVFVIAALFFLVFITVGTAAQKEGNVEYEGAQSAFFKTGKADAVMSLNSLAGRKSLYAIGPIDGLDGEITVFDSKPYITKVRGNDFTLEQSFNYGASFLVWTEQSTWTDIAVPDSVKGYADLQQFVKTKAEEAGIDVSKPFAFLLTGTADLIKWHINIDRTDGKPINKELFANSKEHFITKNELVDIIGFYSESHQGKFISAYTPALGPETKNVIHFHFVSRDSKAAGHIDDISLGKNIALHLPR